MRNDCVRTARRSILVPTLCHSVSASVDISDHAMRRCLGHTVVRVRGLKRSHGRLCVVVDSVRKGRVCYTVFAL